MSIRLYPHNELAADDIVSELCAQAGLAVGNGFDGVMTSEHHGGFAGYMAQPLQMASFVLAGHATGWAAAAPLLLPLRSTALVAEGVAWLQARHPGRVGLGVAAGALPRDFEVAGVSQADAVDRFKSELPRLVAMLRGEDLGALDGDPAFLACRRTPVPVLNAAVSWPPPFEPPAAAWASSWKACRHLRDSPASRARLETAGGTGPDPHPSGVAGPGALRAG